MYSAQVLDHFQNPRHAGDLPGADVTVQVSNPGCGDIMQLALRLSGERIAETRFKTKGCVTAVACSSRLMELVQGKTVAQARAIRREELVESLGGLTPETMHASHLVMDALNEALKGL
ncbi:MAG: iron-sulfur cluster assembly scaffold protein [Acidobacteriales bacterium]|nr:iron-sulfur cluster assembly scaffold protein [Terriglobales bacterium]